jgi:hypothetical protein
MPPPFSRCLPNYIEPLPRLSAPSYQLFDKVLACSLRGEEVFALVSKETNSELSWWDGCRF